MIDHNHFICHFIFGGHLLNIPNYRLHLRFSSVFCIYIQTNLNLFLLAVINVLAKRERMAFLLFASSVFYC